MSNSISKKYTKLEPRQHVLTRPGMYVGSVEKDMQHVWVLEGEGNTTTMVKKELTFAPGLYKIFDELLVNAIDHATRLKQSKDTTNHVRNIKVNIDKEKGVIDVYNDGDSIDVTIHPEHKMYIPEMVFGNLMTSTNYDDNEERTIGGQNGIGAKACNIFSKRFSVELVDHKTSKLYVQQWFDNMSQKTDPKITKCARKPYTRITFEPDFERFNMPNGLDDDTYALFNRRVYDVCALTAENVSVYFNDVKLGVKNFERYVDLYVGARGEHPRAYTALCGDRWEVVATYNETCSFEQVSFVNGIWTFRGGKHVDYLATQLCGKLADLIQKRRKVEVKIPHIKNYLTLFVKSTVVNPTFDSQTKDLLTTPMSKFGSRPELDDAFVEKLYKTGIVELAINSNAASEDKQMKKTDGKKQATLKGVIKLDDANFAGTSRSKECTLILTEGDSAKAMALAGLDVVGRDKYGVFPLRGKLLNVKDCNVKKLSENEEISNIKKIMGLESGKVYGGIDQLRYGRIMVMTDADVDGSHIKGLLFNLFHTLWPSLFKTEDFICALRTPIIKARKGVKGGESLSFYTLAEYDKWRESGEVHGWTIKYYKGLATSKDDEAREYFRQMKLAQYKYNEKPSEDAMDLAFNKKRADDRKSWLSGYDPKLDVPTDSKVVYEDFVNKELIHFSNYDIERSIPNICDGLKTSQRKIVYGCFKRKLTTGEIKVAQLASYVSEHSAYHHGEASLQAAIVNMAQDFVGSNNINLLKPNGQFGTRTLGGKNAGSPRYIFTLLSDIAVKIFNPSDSNLLEYMDDDGYPVEPRVYYPIIPMVLVNGALGIGTGFSTNIPCFNPLEIIDCLESKLRGEEQSGDNTKELMPWYRGFKGSIERFKSKWICRGVFRRVGPNKVDVTEVPIGTWTEDYKEFLEELTETNADVKGYTNSSSNTAVHFTVQFASEGALDKYLASYEDANPTVTKLEGLLKLVSNRITTSNMYLFNKSGQITKYATVRDIINEYFDTRLDMYSKRREHLIIKLERDSLLVSERIRFLEMVVNRDIVLHDKGKKELEDNLGAIGFAKIDNTYDFLVKMPIYNMTKDKLLDLKAELDNVTSELNAVKGKMPTQMWSDELKALRPVVEQVLAAEQETEDQPPAKKARKLFKEKK